MPLNPEAVVLFVVALLIFGVAAGWGMPWASSELTTRGWDVDGVGGVSVLSEMHNLLIEAKPDWYVAYPLFHYLVLAVAYAPYLLWLWLRGDFAPAGTYPYGFADAVEAIRLLAIIGRIVTVIMAASMVVLTREIGLRLWGARAGLISAIIVMLAGPVLFYARSTNLDIPVQFWTAGGVLAGVIALQRGLTVPRALLIGALAGVAVATKDQAYGLWVPGLLYLLTVQIFQPEMRAQASRWRPCFALVGGAAVVYAIAGGIVIHPGRFARHVQFLWEFDENFFNLQHANALTALRPATPAGFIALVGDVIAATRVSMGITLALLGLAGLLIYGWRRDTRLLMVMLLGYVLLTILPVRHMQYRYAIFPMFVLALFVGPVVFVGAWRRAMRYAAVLLLAVGLAWEGLAGADLTYQMLQDARYHAGNWFASRAAPGDSAAFYGATHQLPYIPRGVQPVRMAPRADGAPTEAPDPQRVRWVIVAPDYFSNDSRDHSLFLPNPIYEGLLNGTLGYSRVAVFETKPLRSFPLPYLPYVNPKVQIFERIVPSSAR